MRVQVFKVRRFVLVNQLLQRIARVDYHVLIKRTAIGICRFLKLFKRLLKLRPRLLYLGLRSVRVFEHLVCLIKRIRICFLLIFRRHRVVAGVLLVSAVVIFCEIFFLSCVLFFDLLFRVLQGFQCVVELFLGWDVSCTILWLASSAVELLKHTLGFLKGILVCLHVSVILAVFTLLSIGILECSRILKQAIARVVFAVLRQVNFFLKINRAGNVVLLNLFLYVLEVLKCFVYLFLGWNILFSLLGRRTIVVKLLQKILSLLQRLFVFLYIRNIFLAITLLSKRVLVLGRVFKLVFVILWLTIVLKLVRFFLQSVSFGHEAIGDCFLGLLQLIQSLVNLLLRWLFIWISIRIGAVYLRNQVLRSFELLVVIFQLLGC